MIDWNLWFDCNFVITWCLENEKISIKKYVMDKLILRQDWNKNDMSNGMCVVCENGKENLEHLLIDCRHVYGIWDAVERLIKSCISNSFQIGPFIILAGHFQQSVESNMAKMILSITRWMLWKFRNNKKCEGNDMNEVAKCRMLFKELKLHILLLQKQ